MSKPDTSLKGYYERILNLPADTEPTQEWAKEFTDAICPPSAFEIAGFESLFPDQAAAMSYWYHHQMLFAGIGAGGGKTPIAYFCANAALNHHGHKRVLMVTTPGVYPEFTTRGRTEAKQMLGITLPLIPLKGKSREERLRLCAKYESGVFVIPYSLLSTAGGTELLEAIAPTCLIADEAHRLKNPEAAGPNRLWNVLARQKKAGHRITVALMSGTMSTKGIKDHFYLAACSLGSLSPSPTNYHTAKDLGTYLDAGSHFTDGADKVNDILPMVRWARRTFPDRKFDLNLTGARHAYQARLASAPGVVISAGTQCPASLVIANDPSHKPNQGCLDLIKKVDELAMTPDDDEIEYGLHVFKWMYELSSGFYHRRFWDETRWEKEPLKRAVDQLDLQNAYNKELRNWLKGNRDYAIEQGIDSPMLIGRNMSLHGPARVGNTLFTAWKEQHDARFENMPVRESELIMVSDHRLLATESWCRKNKKGGLIWSHHRGFRKVLVNYLRNAGFNVVQVDSGEGDKLNDPKPGVFYCLSLKAFNEGLNLQWGNAMCYAEWPRWANVAEQSLARQHRNGQKEDEVVATTFNASWVDNLTFSATLVDTAYVHQTLGTRQRLITCAYDPAPTLYPRELIAERVTDVQDLSPEAERILLQRFPTTNKI